MKNLVRKIIQINKCPILPGDDSIKKDLKAYNYVTYNI